MRIQGAEVARSEGGVRCRYPVTNTTGTDAHLEFRVEEPWGELISERMDAALVALLFPAMAAGESLIAKGTVSERLLHGLRGPYQEVLRAQTPSLNRIVVEADSADTGPKEASGVATGFSGGVDSFAALADYHYSGDALPGFRLTHLLYNNVGSHGPSGEELFQARYERLAPVAEALGLPFVRVDSNMDAFYPPGTFQRTHTPRNAAVALLLQAGLRRWLYGSTYEYQDCFVGATDSCGHADPVALPLLSTDAMDLVPVGSDSRRVDKLLRVARIPESHRSLDVCIRSRVADRNCSTCYKCKRTLITLEIAGLLETYRDVFDLGAYRRQRVWGMAQVLQRRHPLNRDVIRFARERGFRFPAAARALAAMGAVHGADGVRGLSRRARSSPAGS